MNKEKYKRQYEYYSKNKKEIYEKHKLKMQNDEEYKNKRKQIYKNWYEKNKNKNKQLEQDLYIVLNRIDKAIRKLNSAIDHYDDIQKDWALKCAIRILKGEEILGEKENE